MSQPTRGARTPRIKTTHLGGDKIIRIYWKYNFRSILTSKGSAEPPAEFSQSTEVPDFHWNLCILNAQMQITRMVLNSKNLATELQKFHLFFLSLIPHWRETVGFNLSIRITFNVGTKTEFARTFQIKFLKLFPVGFSGLLYLCAFQVAEHACQTTLTKCFSVFPFYY